MHWGSSESSWYGHLGRMMCFTTCVLTTWEGSKLVQVEGRSLPVHSAIKVDVSLAC